MVKVIKGASRPTTAYLYCRCGAVRKATQPQLGITDPYQLTEAQYQAVLKVLRAQHGLIHRYWHDTTVQMSDFKNEGVVASSAWPYQANGKSWPADSHRLSERGRHRLGGYHNVT
jgi:hypothetical protein